MVEARFVAKHLLKPTEDFRVALLAVAHVSPHPIVPLLSLAAILCGIEMLAAEAIDEGLRIVALGEAVEVVVLAPGSPGQHHRQRATARRHR